ncbi:hypothetical protein GCM10009547_25740 [Sporichthya brevicatena]|uniref:Methyltransferase FkbM domain-containing protein n=1 Tax=Sporichthya brevicatena TaxID=171442 RepID=A0ABN1GWM1_9ACTN
MPTRTLTNKVVRRWKLRGPTHGSDLARDIERRLPTYCPENILDIGANVGQSTRAFRRRFPRSNIYCVEPVRSTFEELYKNTRRLPRVWQLQAAVGAQPGVARMECPPEASDRARILATASGAGANVATEEVEVTTVDLLCDRWQLSDVGLLKIDTEGFDLEVLRGATDVLRRQRVDLVEAEVAMNPRNDTHVPFESVKKFLEPHGYFLFGIYEQVEEWPSGGPNLRRGNVVFISSQMIERYRSSADRL